MMKPVHRLACAATLFCLVLPCAAQTTTDRDTAEVAQDIRGIHEALDRLVGLLESLQRRQSVELLLKRIELSERRQAPLEGRLRSAETDVEHHQGEVEHLEMMRAQMEAQHEQELREGSDVSAEGYRNTLNEYEMTKAVVEARVEEARRRVQRAEDDLIDGRRELEILDEKLMELLETE